MIRPVGASRQRRSQGGSFRAFLKKYKRSCGGIFRWRCLNGRESKLSPGASVLYQADFALSPLKVLVLS